MKEAYPVLIWKDGNDYLVRVPDFDIDTEGETIPDAIFMARDAIGLLGIELEDEGIELPKPHAKEERKEGAIITLVDVDFNEYRKRHDTRLVKKNCTIPYYLSVAAEKEGINCSNVLREALKEKLSLAMP